MNNKIKTIGAALLAAAMCASLAGCAKEEEKPKLTESNIESHIEDIFGNNSSNSPASTPNESEEVKFAVTDEIKNAALDSGFIQINNEVFQQGGYITVAELVEKYKDTYDFTYHRGLDEKGTYDECKDYLLEYKEPNKSFGEIGNNGVLVGYTLKLTPKAGNSKELRSIDAIVGNFTSKDEKITLDKGIVIGYNFAAGPVQSTGFSAHTIHSVWLPQGIGLTDTLNKKTGIIRDVPDDLKTANEVFTLGKFPEFLEQQGFSLAENRNVFSTKNYDKKYTINKSNADYICVYGVGETNLFGQKPLYEYTIFFDSDTDKMSSVRYALIEFVD